MCLPLISILPFSATTSQHLSCGWITARLTSRLPTFPSYCRSIPTTVCDFLQTQHTCMYVKLLIVLYPSIYQVLLSQTHRQRALQLLDRYLALGPVAVNLALLVGIFPYILKLLTGQGSDDSKHILVSIWASIIGFDISCRDQLVKEKSQTHFIQFLSSADMSIQHRTMAAFVLAEICNEYRYKLVSSFFFRGELCI